MARATLATSPGLAEPRGGARHAEIPDPTPDDDSSLDDEMTAVIAEEHCRHDRQMISDFAALTIHVMWGAGRRDAASLKVLEEAVSTPHDLI